jgi:predicted ATPase
VFLEIENIGKIRNAKIELKGVTVIAGKNNTGKSTFGKVLYCMFNAFYDMENTIRNERRKDIKDILARNLVTSNSNIEKPHFNNEMIDEVLSAGKNLSKLHVRKVLNLINTSDDLYAEIFKKIKSSLAIKDDDIQKAIITRYFTAEFNGQINHIDRKDNKGKIIRAVKNNIVEVSILNNRCSLLSIDEKFRILYDAVYIDTPLVMDELPFTPYRWYEYFYSTRHSSPKNYHHRENLKNKLTSKSSDRTIIEEALTDKKLNKLLAKISVAIPGKFTIEENYRLLFHEEGLKKPLHLSNMSAGIKTFLIIKRLLEAGEIKERGVLILDEPEIHLHPEWQLRFAEILILLQKEFNLTILLTTHSPYFLNAIEVYSDKYGRKDSCNYYLASTVENATLVREVTANTDEIYKQLAMPFKTLESMEYDGD